MRAYLMPWSMRTVLVTHTHYFPLTFFRCLLMTMARLTMNFDRRYAVCVQKVYHRPHFTVGGRWNKSLHLQPLQRCYCKNSGSPASAFVIRRHFSIKYTQPLHGIIGLLSVGRVGNVLFRRSSYVITKVTKI